MRSDMKKKNDRFFVVLNMLCAISAALVNYFVNFFITPYITENVGVDAYGFISLAITMISYIDIIAVALNAFAGRYISIAYHEKRYDKANVYFNSVIISNLVFSILLILPSSIFIINIQNILNVPNRLIFDVKVLFWVIIINYVVSLAGVGYSTATFIVNRIDKSERVKALSHLVKAVVIFILCSFFSPHVWYIGLSYVIASVLILFTNIKFTHTLTPELYFAPKLFSIKAVLELLSAGIWNSLNALGNVLNDGLDLLITNRMLSAESMGQVSVGKNLSTFYNVLLSAICNAFKPRQLRFYAEGKIDDLINELKISMRCCGFITTLIFAGFVSCGKMFLQCWIPTQDINIIYPITCICMAGNLIVGSVTPLYYVYTLTKRLKFPSLITIFMGFANVIGMYLLLTKTSLGLYAVVLTTAVLNTTIHFFDAPLYSATCLNVKLRTFYPEIIKHLFSCLITTISLCLLVKTLPVATSWSMLVLVAIPCVIVGCFMAAVTTFTRNEIKYFLKKIVK